MDFGLPIWAGRSRTSLKPARNPSSSRPPMKTRLALLALAATLPVAATPPVHVPELSSTLPLLAGGLILLGVLASRLKK